MDLLPLAKEPCHSYPLTVVKSRYMFLFNTCLLAASPKSGKQHTAHIQTRHRWEILIVNNGVQLGKQIIGIIQLSGTGHLTAWNELYTNDLEVASNASNLHSSLYKKWYFSVDCLISAADDKITDNKYLVVLYVNRFIRLHLSAVSL